MKNKNIKILVASLMCSSILGCISANAMRDNKMPYNNIIFNNTNINLKNNQQNDKMIIKKLVENINKKVEDFVMRIYDLYENKLMKYKKEENIPNAEKIEYNNEIAKLKSFYENEYEHINKIDSKLASEFRTNFFEKISFIPKLESEDNNNKMTNKNLVIRKNLKNLENRNQKLNDENKEKGYNTNYDYIDKILKENARLKNENEKLKQTTQTCMNNYKYVNQELLKVKQDREKIKKQFNSATKKCDELMQENEKLKERTNNLERNSYYGIYEQKTTHSSKYNDITSGLNNGNIYENEYFANLKDSKEKIDEEYNYLKKELIAKENESWRFQIENKKLEEKINEIKEYLNIKNKEIKEMRMKIEKLTSEENPNLNYKENVNILKNTNYSLRKELKSLEDENEDKKEFYEQIKKEYDEMNQKFNNANNEYNMLMEENKMLEKEKAELKKMEKEIRRLMDESRKMKEEYNDLVKEDFGTRKDEGIKNIKKLKKENEMLKYQNENQKKSNENTRREYEEIKQKYDSANNEYNVLMEENKKLKKESNNEELKETKDEIEIQIRNDADKLEKELMEILTNFQSCPYGILYPIEIYRPKFTEYRNKATEFKRKYKKYYGIKKYKKIIDSVEDELDQYFTNHCSTGNVWRPK